MMGMLSPQLHDVGCRSACGVSVNDDNETTTTTTGEESGRRWGETTGRRTRTTCGIGSTRGGGEDASRGYCVAGGTTGRRQQFVSRSVAWDFVRPSQRKGRYCWHCFLRSNPTAIRRRTSRDCIRQRSTRRIGIYSIVLIII